MPRRWTALGGLLLAAAILRPAPSGAQRREPPPKPPPVSLGQNAPNPFDEDTRIPFTIGDAATCRDPARTYRVTLRIYNLLSQVVAVPVLLAGASGTPPSVPLEGASLPCGSYVALWDGRYLSTGARAYPGIYLYRLEVDGGASPVRKLVIVR